MDSATRPVKIEPFSAETSAVFDFYVKRAARVFLILSWTISIGLFVLVPTITHVHFSITGKEEYWENKSFFLIFPGICTFLFIYISRINRHALGYWADRVVKGRNNIVYYSLTRKALHVLKATFPLCWIVCCSARVLVLTGHIDKPEIVLNILYFIFTIPFFYYFFQSLRYMK